VCVFFSSPSGLVITSYETEEAYGLFLLVDLIKQNSC